MKQIYYAIQSTLHGRGSNVTKVISLSLGLTIGYGAQNEAYKTIY